VTDLATDLHGRFAGAPVALLAGYLADLWRRKLLFVIIVFLGELPTLCTLFVTEYWQLFLLRCLTGIAIGGGPPLVMSMLGDMFPAHNRMTVISYFVAVGALGVALGQLVAGMTGPVYGWRVPFAIIAVPACVVNVLVLFTVAEPKRGYADLSDQDNFKKDKGEAGPVYEYDSRITPGRLFGLYTIKSNVIFFLQGIPGCFPWAATITFMNDYLSQEKGLSVQASTVVMTAYNLGICLGIIIGGALGQVLYNLRPRLVPLLMGTTTFAGMFPLVWIIWLPDPPPFIGVLPPCVPIVYPSAPSSPLLLTLALAVVSAFLSSLFARCHPNITFSSNPRYLYVSMVFKVQG